MKTLVVGAGAIGGYFGGRLMEGGCDVTFLVRPARREQLAATGLVIKSRTGDFSAPAKTVVAGEIDGPYDLILLTCKAYGLDQAMADFAPAVGPDTLIVPLLNGMAHLDRLAERFGEKAVLGGLCACAMTMDPEGRIVHLNEAHLLTFGDRDGQTSDKTRALADMMKPARIVVRVSEIIIQEMWEKWAFLASLAGINNLMRGAVCDIVTAGGMGYIVALHEEIRSIAKAAGHEPRPEVQAGARQMLTKADSPLTASMLRDVEKGGPAEVDHVIGDLLARGRTAGLALPILNLVHTHLKTFEARRKRETA